MTNQTRKTLQKRKEKGGNEKINRDKCYICGVSRAKGTEEKAVGQNGHKRVCCSTQAIASVDMLKSMILVKGRIIREAAKANAQTAKGCSSTLFGSETLVHIILSSLH